MIIPSCPICNCSLINQNDLLFCTNIIKYFSFSSKHYWLKFDPNEDYPLYEEIIVPHNNKIYVFFYDKTFKIYSLNELKKSNNNFINAFTIYKLPPPKNYTPIISLFEKLINLIPFS